MDFVRSSARAAAQKRSQKRYVKHEYYLQYVQEIFAGVEEMDRLEKLAEYLREVDEDDPDYVSFCSKFPYEVFWQYTVTRPNPELTTEALYCFGKVTYNSHFNAESFASPETFGFLTTALQVCKRSSKAALEVLICIASASSDLCRLVYENFIGTLMALPVSKQLASLVDTLFSRQQTITPDVIPVILKLLATDTDVNIWTTAFSAMCFVLGWELNEEQVKLLWSVTENNLSIYMKQIDRDFVHQFLKVLAKFSPMPPELGVAVFEKFQFFMSTENAISDNHGILIQCAYLVARHSETWRETLAVPWAQMTFTIFDGVPYRLQRALVKALNSLWDFSSIRENAEYFAGANFKFINDETIGVTCMVNLAALIEANKDNPTIFQLIMENQSDLEALTEVPNHEIAEAASAILDQI